MNRRRDGNRRVFEASFWSRPQGSARRLEGPSGVAEETNRGRNLGWKSSGFSLLETLASMAIMLIIMSAIVSVISFYQKTYQTTQLKSDMYENVRGTMGLMTQELGQSGLVSLPSPSPTLSSAAVASSSAQTVGVSSTTSMFVGEKLLIDSGVSEEAVTLTAVDTTLNQITGVFSKAHASGAPIDVLGVFPDGVMTSSTGTQLRLFGDINADGSLVYIHYDCDTAAGTLTRSVTTLTPSTVTSSAAQTLLSTLIANPGGTPCFQYITQSSTATQTIGTGTGSQGTFTGTLTQVGVSAGNVWVAAGSVTGTDDGSGSITGTGISSGTVNYATGAISVTFLGAPGAGTAVGVGQYFVTNVAVTITVRTLQIDPQTHAYLTMTTSFRNLSPRNVVSGLELANLPFPVRLQPTPSNLPLP
jgi:Tfp pilus assembly protein PilW